MKLYEWTLFEISGEDECYVADGVAPSEGEAMREANHYAMMYSQDCDVRVQVFVKDMIVNEVVKQRKPEEVK